jgi:hypothetical protein
MSNKTTNEEIIKNFQKYITLKEEVEGLEKTLKDNLKNREQASKDEENILLQEIENQLNS